MNQYDEPMVITFQAEDGGLLVYGPWVICDDLPGHALDLTTHQIVVDPFPQPAPIRSDIPAPGGLALTGLAILVMLRRRRNR